MRRQFQIQRIELLLRDMGSSIQPPDVVREIAVYAERTELTGADGGPVATTDATQRAARAATLLKLAQARKALDEIDIDDLV